MNTDRISQSTEQIVFADIYQEDINITNWQRDLSPSLKKSVSDFLSSKPSFETSLTVTSQDAASCISNEIKVSENSELVNDIAELVDLFSFLLETTHVGLRLASLDRAMCPKFHVDRVPCRLVTTYQGIVTQWLPHNTVDRSKLGIGGGGLPDHQSGIYQNPSDIQQLESGDVALLKGETWGNNENAGLVHRSPELSNEENRLLLTLDLVG